MPLVEMPLGSVIHNVELKPGAGGQIARSAGIEVQLLGRSDENGRAQLRLPSGKSEKWNQNVWLRWGRLEMRNMLM